MAEEVQPPQPFKDAFPELKQERIEGLIQYPDFAAFYQLRNAHDALTERVRGGEKGLDDIVDPFTAAYPRARQVLKGSLQSKGYTPEEIQAAESVARGEVVIEYKMA